ncbi:MAG: SAM-dependent methyltransferase, partial [Bacteroidota bacterium]
GYDIFRSDHQVDKIIDHLYFNVLNSYWDKERKYIDEHYKTIPFPFNEIKSPELNIAYHWDLDQLIGFLNSWSGVQHYKDRNNNENPLDQVTSDLKNCFKENEKKKVTFPVFLRVGKKN